MKFVYNINVKLKRNIFEQKHCELTIKIDTIILFKPT